MSAREGITDAAAQRLKREYHAARVGVRVDKSAHGVTLRGVGPLDASDRYDEVQSFVSRIDLDHSFAPETFARIAAEQACSARGLGTLVDRVIAAVLSDAPTAFVAPDEEAQR